MNETMPQEDKPEAEKIYYGAITIFYKNTPEGRRFLVVTNKETDNISFVSGAQEEVDEGSSESAAKREVTEELQGLDPDGYDLTWIDVRHEFVFGEQKKERAGNKGSYQVFVSDLTKNDSNISHTHELDAAEWLSEEEVLDKLTFPDLKDVFTKTLEQLS